MTFVADFETLPAIDPGEYAGVTLRRQPAVLEVGAVDETLEQLRQRHARWHPIEDRAAEPGDTLLLNTLVTTETGPLTQEVTFTLAAGVNALLGQAAWEISTAAGPGPARRRPAWPALPAPCARWSGSHPAGCSAPGPRSRC